MTDVSKYTDLLVNSIKSIVESLTMYIRDVESGMRKYVYNKLVRSSIVSSIMVNTDLDAMYDGVYFSPTTNSKVEISVNLNKGYYEKFRVYEVNFKPVYADPKVVEEAIRYLEVKNPKYGKYSFDKDDVNLVGAHIQHSSSSTPIYSEFKYSSGMFDKIYVTLTSSSGFGYRGNVSVCMCTTIHHMEIGGQSVKEVEKCIYGEAGSFNSILYGLEIHGSRKGITVREVDKVAFINFMKALAWSSLIYTKMVIDSMAEGLYNTYMSIKKEDLRSEFGMYMLYP